MKRAVPWNWSQDKLSFVSRQSWLQLTTQFYSPTQAKQPMKTSKILSQVCPHVPVPCLTVSDPKCSCLFWVSILRPLSWCFWSQFYVMREGNLYHNTYAKTSRLNRLLVQVNIPLTWVNLVASVLEAVMGQSGSHPGLIVALASSLHGIIGPG